MKTSKVKEESHKKFTYHGRNITGRENLITCERTNELTQTSLTEFIHSVVNTFLFFGVRSIHCTMHGSERVVKAGKSWEHLPHDMNMKWI